MSALEVVGLALNHRLLEKSTYYYKPPLLEGSSTKLFVLSILGPKANIDVLVESFFPNFVHYLRTIN